MRKSALIICVLLLCVAGGVLFTRRGSRAARSDHKVIVLGIDGLDPQLLRRFIAAGKMPNFAALVAKGTFRELTTSIPPQSPVAWSNLITGMNPGGHGIFDFIHRDPKTMQPYFSTSQVEPPKHNLRLGGWVIPLGSGRADLLRHGPAFWEILQRRGIPATVFRMPANFPPVTTKARSFAGMGTPDLRGTYGTFSYYTDDPLAVAGPVEGGETIPVQLQGSRVNASLVGPANSFRKGAPPATIAFTAAVDPVEPVVKIKVQDQQFILRESEWSDWVKLDFPLIPAVQGISGICRFLLKQAHPRFELYVSPINIDPANPALPLSTPSSYSRELSQEVGYFYTQGISEDTKALSAGVLDDGEYLQQARTVLAEHRKIFGAEFPKFHSGLFFFYFSSLDLNGHMFWRLLDPRHPAYNRSLAAQYSGALEQFYQQMDEVLGEVLARIDDRTSLFVVSDHGFAPYNRSFNLNTWLLNNGYLALKSGANQEEGQYFANVDWSRTRAYGLGLNGLYLNLRGRERNGIVEPGKPADDLGAELSRRLLQVRDPGNGSPVITRMDWAKIAYQGAFVSQAPDLIVGYNRGYRAGWRTILGAFPKDVLEDNTNAWSGDHCMDYTQVPGVLLSNRKIPAQSPALTDIAPTILAEFGIAKPKEMLGEPLLGVEKASR